MELQTYAQIYNKAILEMDLQDENFLGTDEILGYINEALKNAETAIHSLGAEDNYFLTYDTMTLVRSQQAYTPPTDIYANKFRKLFYINGSRNYEIVKIRRLLEIPGIQAGEDYRFILTNKQLESGGVQINIFPLPTENGPLVQRWYIRSVRQLTNSTTDINNKCELPECANFIHQHIRLNLAKKLRRPDLIASEKEDLLTQYNLMIETLKEMIPDENNQLLGDFQSYEDQEVDVYN